MLSVESVGFAYNGHPILKQINFALGQGVLLCVLGVNGAGKSTLLKCLNRILAPTHGAVLLGGQALPGLSRNDIARQVGYVPQRHPETQLTVFETVLLGRRPHLRMGLSGKDYALVEDILRQMGLSDLAARPVRDLSGGEIQKVVIARALAQTPKLLLLDEPTSNLDLKNQLEVMGLIRGVDSERLLSAVVAIHDLNLAVRFADSFLFLKDHQVHSLVDRKALTEETIGQVYGVDVALRQVGGHTIVVPM